jgi:hypothetical protein
MGAGAKGTPSPASPSHRTFKKILAANRGEIAIRIMRAGVSGKSRADERLRAVLMARHGFPTSHVALEALQGAVEAVARAAVTHAALWIFLLVRRSSEML